MIFSQRTRHAQDHPGVATAARRAQHHPAPHPRLPGDHRPITYKIKTA